MPLGCGKRRPGGAGARAGSVQQGGSAISAPLPRTRLDPDQKATTRTHVLSTREPREPVRTDKATCAWRSCAITPPTDATVAPPAPYTDRPRGRPLVSGFRLIASSGEGRRAAWVACERATHKPFFPSPTLPARGSIGPRFTLARLRLLRVHQPRRRRVARRPLRPTNWPRRPWRRSRRDQGQ